MLFTDVRQLLFKLLPATAKVGLIYKRIIKVVNCKIEGGILLGAITLSRNYLCVCELYLNNIHPFLILLC